MNTAQRKLIIYLPTMASGGAERLHAHLAPAFIAAGYEVTFLLHRAEGPFISAIPPEARVISLNRKHTLQCLVPLVRFLRRERPGILLANLGHNNIMAIWAAALARVPTRIIASQHSVLSAETSGDSGWRHLLLPILYRLFLGRAHGIVAVSGGVAEDLSAVARIKRGRITVIHNPAIFEGFDARMAEPVAHEWLKPGGPPVILGAGRLVPSKDFATLLKAFAILRRKKDARLILLGEGPLRDELLALAGSLGIAADVDMPGFQENPLPFMRAAALLAMSSRYEGFGNVLAEALACGTPVVSTDCPYGPAEILDGGRFGALVPVGDDEVMAAAMLDTLERPPAGEILRARGREFSVARAADLYMRLFDVVS